MNAMNDWLWRHPLLYPLILTILSALFSIYSQDIKQFLHHWPRTRERRRKAAADDLIKRLALLKRLHNDSYQLIIFLVLKFTDMIFFWVGLVFVFAVVSVMVRTHILDAEVGYGLLTGTFIGYCQTVREVLRQLRNYDETVANLQQRLSKLEP